MTANFKPEQNSYKDLGQFRFWCQKVLPLTYDDSLSYYELLCKVVNILNETINNVSLTGEDMTKLYSAYEELQTFVNNYFTNLDVQEEINSKLDNMANDGALSKLISPIISISSVPLFVNSVSAMVDTARAYVLSTNGHIYYYTDTWTDSGLVYGITDGVYRPSNVRVSVDNASVLSDANNAIKGVTYFIDCHITKDMVLNLPEYSAFGCLTTIHFNENYEHGLYQIYVTRNAMYYRFEYGGAEAIWSEWTNVSSSSNYCTSYTSRLTFSFDDTNKIIKLTPIASGRTVLYSQNAYTYVNTELTVEYPVTDGSYQIVVNNDTLRLVKYGELIYGKDVVIGTIWISTQNTVYYYKTVFNTDKYSPSNYHVGDFNYKTYLTDANNAINGLTYFINSNITKDMIPNLPEYGTFGCLTTIHFSDKSVDGKYQLYVTPKNLYYRFETGGGNGTQYWYNWINTNGNKYAPSGIHVTYLNYETYLTDANNAVKGLTYFISSNITKDMVSNLPEYGVFGCLTTIHFSDTSEHGMYQLYATKNDMYYRFEHGSTSGTSVWYDWKSLVNRVSNKVDISLLSTFASLGVIGDSLSVGYMTDTVTGQAHNRNLYYSWGQYLARKHGMKVVNFGQSGATTKSWTIHENCYPLAMQTENLCQGYIIGIGTNDKLTGDNMTYANGLGTLADVNTSDYTKNADSFYGYYGGVIQRLKELVPNCIIFCMTIPYPRVDSNKNNAIKEICELFSGDNVLLVDLAGDYGDLYANRELTQYYYERHFTACGYKAVADLIDYCVTDVMLKNPNVVQNIGFIDTTS